VKFHIISLTLPQAVVTQAMHSNSIVTNVLLELISVREGVFSLYVFGDIAIQQLSELICIN